MATIGERIQAFKYGMALAKSGLIGGNAGLQSSLQNLLSPKWNQVPARNTAQFLDMYSKNPRMNPIRKISEDVAGAKYQLYTNVNKEVPIEKHPMLDLLLNPNPMPEFTGYMTRYLTQVYVLIKGEAYWILERNGLGQPTEIWIVPPHWVRQTPSIYRPYYTIQPLGVSTMGIRYVPTEDVIAFKDPNPLDPFSRGIGQAEGIADEIETDEYMAKYNKRFFFNDATPPLIVTAIGADTIEADRMEEDWMTKHGGVNNHHKPAFLNWDAKITLLGQAQKEMEFIDGRKYLRDACNQHFNIPPEVMGIIENSNRATIDSAFYLYAKNVLNNKLRLIEDVINTQLSPMFKDDPYFEYDNIVPEDKEFLLKQMNDGVDRNTVTIDEWRSANEMDAMPNKVGESVNVKMGITPTAIADLLKKSLLPPITPGTPPVKPNVPANEDDALDGDNKSIKKKITKADRKAIAKAVEKNNANRIAERDKLSAPLENLFNKAMKTYLKDLKDDVVQKVNNGSKDPVDTEKWDIKLQDVTKPLYEKVFKSGGNAVVNEFKSILVSINKDDSVAFGFDFASSEVKVAIKNKVMKIKGVNQTTKDSVATLIKNSYDSDENFTIPQIAKAISNMPAFDAARAATIAQTETLTSLNQATSLCYKQNADLIDGKAWLASNDSRTRESHMQASMDYGEENAIPIDDPFNVGGYDCDCPGDDSLPAEEVINCRCSMAPIIKA